MSDHSTQHRYVIEDFTLYIVKFGFVFSYLQSGRRLRGCTKLGTAFAAAAAVFATIAAAAAFEAVLAAAGTAGGITGCS